MATPSFAFQVPDAVQQAMPQGAQPALLGLQGQESQFTSAPAGIDTRYDTTSRTVDALLNLGKDLLQPKVEQEKRRMAAEGAIAAIQGVSAKEIQDNEFFGGMFGDSVTVASARQVERMDALTKLSNSMMESMNEIKQMPAPEFRNWLPKQFDQFMTGDEESDSLITAAFVERLPSLVDMHTKAHAQFRQDEARKAFTSDIISRGQALQNTLAGEKAYNLSPDLVINEKQAFAAALMGPQGVHPEAYPKWINQVFRDIVGRGNFQAAEVMWESGVLEATQDAAQVDVLRKYQDSAEVRNRARNPRLVNIMADLGTFEARISDGSSHFTSVEQVMAALDEFDRRERLETGAVTTTITNQYRKQIAESFVKGKEAAARRLASIDDPQVQANYAVAALEAGRGAYDAVYQGLSATLRTDVNNKLVDAWMQEGTLHTAGFAVMERNPGVTFDKFRAHLRTGLGALADGRIAANSPAALEDVRELLATGRERVLADQLGDQDLVTFAIRAAELVDPQTGTDPAALQKIAQAVKTENAVPITQQQIKEAEELTLAALPNALERAIGFNVGSDVYGGIEITDREATARQIAPELARSIARHIRLGEGFDRAFELAAAENFQVRDFGLGVVAVKRPGGGTFHEQVAKAAGRPVQQTDEDYQNALRLALTSRYRELYPSYKGDFTVKATAFEGGVGAVATFVATIEDAHGRPAYVRFPASSVVEWMGKHKRREATSLLQPEVPDINYPLQ